MEKISKNNYISQSPKYITQKGITLIALVITIIVLLILAGVAINMAIDSNGLFGKANEAVESWNTSVENERSEIQGLLDKLGVYEKVVGAPEEWRVEGTTIVEYLGDKTTYTDIVIPNYVGDIAVDTIGAELFKDNKIVTSLTISKGIKTIGNYAFAGCSNLSGNLVIPDSVININDFSFGGCSGFTGDLIIPDSVTIIGKNAFVSCRGFNGDLVIGNSVTTISREAFSSCTGFTGDLKIGDSVTTIETYAFVSCTGFTGDLVIPNSVTIIEDYAFSACRGFTGNLVLGNCVTTIGNAAFDNCSGFTGNLVIPDSVTNIGGSAFVYCTGFDSITIPSAVEIVGENAFDGVKQIYYYGSLSTDDWGAVKVNDET